jgi:predicted Zn-dependent protease
MPRTSSRAAALLALLAAAIACATLSVEDERKLGDQFAREVKKEVVFVRDRAVVDYVSRLGAEIVRASGPQPFEYHFYVIEDQEINAFAAPAGHVYVHTGTLLKARDVSELAGVMAHEVGHVARRHIAHNYRRQQGTRIGQQLLVIGAGVAGGQAAAGAANLLTGLGAMAYLNSFGRDAERDADAFAVAVMPRAGYDPEGLVTFFHTLQKEGGSRPPAFLSSHPTTEERIEGTRRMIAEGPHKGGLRRHDGGRLEIIQERVRLIVGQRRR